MKPVLTQISTVSQVILHLRIVEGIYIPYKQVPYEEIPDAQFTTGRQGERILLLDEKRHGVVVENGKTLSVFDRIVGDPVNRAAIEDPGNFRISSEDDPNYASPASPEKVDQKIKPVNHCDSDGRYQYQFDLFLRIPVPLAEACLYRIDIDHLGLARQSYSYFHSTSNNRSEAIHVSQVGFAPEDPVKRAYLSMWLGTGGACEYEEGKPFQVTDADSGRVVHQGLVSLAKPAAEPEGVEETRNYTRSPIYLMDFSALNESGVFKIQLSGIGCSYPFEISETCWQTAFQKSMRGLYHNRSGVELNPPYSDFKRPRTYHPDDGLKVYRSTTSLMDSGNGLNALGTDTNNFGNLVKGKTDEIVPGLWGGYFDAGDWDRRIQHLDASRHNLELFELRPGFFSRVDLSIPETGNGLPDLINEALFGIDAYKRFQTADGGVRGGIEAEEHPCQGETSWQESLTVMTYEPDIWCSYLYCGVAARAARLVEAYAPDRAQDYRASAGKAIRWAEARYPKWWARTDVTDRARKAVFNSRNLAAVEMYHLTGEPSWHDIYLKTRTHDLGQNDADFVYLMLPIENVSPKVKNQCLELLLSNADHSVAMSERNGFNIAVSHPEQKPGPYRHFFSTPHAVPLVRAHHLTGRKDYLAAILKACQFGAGANPLNLCYTTGIGHAYPENPMHIDTRRIGEKVPTGITIYGNYDIPGSPGKKDWFRERLLDENIVTPAITEWPVAEMYFDIFVVAPMNEWTTTQTLGLNPYVWGYLAAR